MLIRGLSVASKGLLTPNLQEHAGNVSCHSLFSTDLISTVPPPTTSPALTTPGPTTTTAVPPTSTANNQFCELFGSTFRPVPGTECAQYTQSPSPSQVFTFTCPFTLRFDTEVCICNYPAQFTCLV